MPLWVDRERALYGSWYEFFPRSEGAVADPDGRAALGHVPDRDGAAARGRRRWASTSSTCRRSTPSARPTARARTTRSPPARTTSAHRGRSAAPEGGHDAIHPDLGTIADFDGFVARARELGMEVALDFALQAPRTTRGSTTTPSGSPSWPTARSPTPRTRRRSTRTSTRSTSTATPTASIAEMLRVVRHWMDHGVRIFRVDNPHTKPVAFWEWLIAEVRTTDPDVLFLAEAFTRPAMMQTLARVGFHQSYTYFTWRNEKRELEEYLTELRAADGALPAAQLLRQHPRHPARLPAVRRPAGVQDPGRRSRRRCRRPGASTRATSCSSTSRCGRAARSTSTPRSTSCARATGPPPRREGRSLAPYLTHAQRRSGARTRRCSSCATCASTAPTATRSSASPRRDDGHGDDTRARGRQPRPARGPRDDGPPGHAGTRAGLDATLSRCTTRSPAQTYAWGQAQLRAPGPVHEPAHVFRSSRGAVRPTGPSVSDRPPTSTSSSPTARDRQLRRRSRTTERDPDWFKRAVFYEVLVRVLQGQQRRRHRRPAGLTDKLDYLHWLGVDCLWLPPFFASPLRDGGYDVARLHRRAAEFGTSATSWSSSTRRTPAACA